MLLPPTQDRRGSFVGIHLFPKFGSNKFSAPSATYLIQQALCAIRLFRNIEDHSHTDPLAAEDTTDKTTRSRRSLTRLCWGSRVRNKLELGAGAVTAYLQVVKMLTVSCKCASNTGSKKQSIRSVLLPEQGAYILVYTNRLPSLAACDRATIFVLRWEVVKLCCFQYRDSGALAQFPLVLKFWIICFR